MKIICAEKLTHLFKDIDEEGNVKDENKALDGVDIEVEKGQFIAVLGHNGSGKSTFAKHINALLLPDGGSMTVNGFDTKNEDNIWDIRQSAGMVFQNPDNQIIATVVEDDIASSQALKDLTSKVTTLKETVTNQGGQLTWKVVS